MRHGARWLYDLLGKSEHYRGTTNPCPRGGWRCASVPCLGWFTVLLLITGRASWRAPSGGLVYDAYELPTVVPRGEWLGVRDMFRSGVRAMTSDIVIFQSLGGAQRWEGGLALEIMGLEIVECSDSSLDIPVSCETTPTAPSGTLGILLMWGYTLQHKPEIGAGGCTYHIVPSANPLNICAEPLRNLRTQAK